MKIDFNKHAFKWHKNKPRHYGDFCGKPEAIEIAKKIGKGKVILDLGCGEGFYSRKMADFAKKVIGIDNAKGMLDLAIEQEKREKRGIDYRLGNVKNMNFIENSSIDICIGNYVVNYIETNELKKFYGEISRVLKPGGSFILVLPHPYFWLALDFGESVSHKPKEFDYNKSRGIFFFVKTKTVDGDNVDIGMYHSRLEDHFDAIAKTCLIVNQIVEPIFSKELAKKYPTLKAFAGKSAGMIFVGSKI